MSIIFINNFHRHAQTTIATIKFIITRISFRITSLVVLSGFKVNLTLQGLPIR